MDFFGLEDDLFLSHQLVFDLADDEIEVAGVGDVVQVVCRHGQHRAQAEAGNPFLIDFVELFQVIDGDLTFVVAPAVLDAVIEG